jgi:MATE family multidrug resistance protein
VSIFCLGVIAAVGTLVAIRKGAGDIEGATRLTQAGLWLAWAWRWRRAGAVEPSTGAAAVRPEPENGLGRRISHPAAAGPARLPDLHGLARLHQRLGRSTPVMVISLVGTVLNYLLNTR